LNESVIPRIGAKDAALARFLDDQIGRLARDSSGDTGQLYARIQAEYQNEFPPATSPKSADTPKPHASTGSELRDM
jgi:hypothetical protein